MFVPSEGVYYELLMSSDSKGVPLDAYCRQKNVIPVSPNSLYAHLSVILMGLKGLQIEENARRLHSSLSGLKTQWDNFAGVYESWGLICATHSRVTAMRIANWTVREMRSIRWPRALCPKRPRRLSKRQRNSAQLFFWNSCQADSTRNANSPEGLSFSIRSSSARISAMSCGALSI